MTNPSSPRPRSQTSRSSRGVGVRRNRAVDPHDERSRGRIIPAVADEETLQILKQGVEAWNDWRKASYKASDLRIQQWYKEPVGANWTSWETLARRRPGLSGADISGMKLSGTDLTNV